MIVQVFIFNLCKQSMRSRFCYIELLILHKTSLVGGVVQPDYLVY